MKVDVAVLGAGSAGVAAAIAAARTGARVALVERQQRLGGMATNAFVHSICGLYLLREEHEPIRFANPGFPKEFAESLIRSGATRGPVRMGRLDVLLHEPPVFGRLCEELARAAGELEFFTQAELLEASAGDGPSIASVRIGSSGSQQLLEAQTFVDTTGDATLAHLANAQTGRVPLEKLQRPAFVFAITGVSGLPGETRLRIAHAISSAVMQGELPQGALGAAFREGVHPGQAWGTIDLQGTGFDPNDLHCISEAKLEGRSLASALMAFLQANIEEFLNAKISAFPVCLGVRESRRITGRYELSGQDLLAGKRFEDEVALACWPMELREKPTGPRFRFPEHNQPCGIPLRSLQSRTFKNLFMAGRCLSADHEAQAAVRVIGTCLATGEAAGKAAAALCSR